MTTLTLPRRSSCDPIIEAKFRRLVEKHDIGFALSDDHRCYTAGAAERIAIEALALQMPRKVAVRIWNEIVDRKFQPPARLHFYWPTE